MSAAGAAVGTAGAVVGTAGAATATGGEASERRYNREKKIHASRSLETVDGSIISSRLSDCVVMVYCGLCIHHPALPPAAAAPAADRLTGDVAVAAVGTGDGDAGRAGSSISASSTSAPPAAAAPPARDEEAAAEAEAEPEEGGSACCSSLSRSISLPASQRPCSTRPSARNTLPSPCRSPPEKRPSKRLPSGSRSTPSPWRRPSLHPPTYTPCSGLPLECSPDSTRTPCRYVPSAKVPSARVSRPLPLIHVPLKCA